MQLGYQLGYSPPATFVKWRTELGVHATREMTFLSLDTGDRLLIQSKLRSIVRPRPTRPVRRLRCNDQGGVQGLANGTEGRVIRELPGDQIAPFA